MAVADAAPTPYDLLVVDGEDLPEWPLIERKRRLRQLIPSVPTTLYVEGLCLDPRSLHRKFSIGIRSAECGETSFV